MKPPVICGERVDFVLVDDVPPAEHTFAGFVAELTTRVRTGMEVPPRFIHGAQGVVGLYVNGQRVAELSDVQVEGPVEDAVSVSYTVSLPYPIRFLPGRRRSAGRLRAWRRPYRVCNHRHAVSGHSHRVRKAQARARRRALSGVWE